MINNGFLDIPLYKKTNRDIVLNPAGFLLNPSLDKIKKNGQERPQVVSPSITHPFAIHNGQKAVEMDSLLPLWPFSYPEVVGIKIGMFYIEKTSHSWSTVVHFCNQCLPWYIRLWTLLYFRLHLNKKMLVYRLPYLFAYKPISAISRDPKLFHVSSCCIEIKNKHKTFGYKPRPNNCKVLHACR